MKAIIYAGIGLFSVATVYGVADYYSSHKKGSLDKLYAEEEIPPVPKVEEKTTAVIPVINVETGPVENKTVTTKVKSVKKAKATAHKKIRMEDFSRARIPEEVIAEDIKIEPVKKEDKIMPEKITVVPAEKLVVKEDAERKISLDMYSRAPLKKHIKPVKIITKKD